MEAGRAAERVAFACEACRKRKRKCDGITPSCSWCLQKSIACHYVLQRPKKPKLDYNYVNGLETQIELLKEEVYRLKGLCQSVPQSQGMPDTSDNSLQDGNPRTSKDDSAINDVSSLMWRLKIGDNGESTLIGPSGNHCFSNTIDDSTQTNGHATQEVILNQRHEMDHTRLILLFSKYINPTFQFLDQETLASLTNHASQEPNFLACSVLAAGSLYAEEVEIRSYGNHLASRIEAKSLETCRQSPNLATIQSLAIMCWRELALGNENMAWMYNSMACSLSIHLGLTVISLQELRRGEIQGNHTPEMPKDLRQRTRTIWSVLLLDRVATSLLGRHCIIPWRRIKAPYLVEVLGAAATTDELAFDFQCKLWYLHDKHMDRIYSYEFKDLDKTERYRLLVEARDELLSFRTQLKAQFDQKEESETPTIIFCHMAYHMSQLLIHRPYLNGPIHDHTRQIVDRTTTLEAGSMVDLIRRYQKVGSFDKVPPFVVHSIQTAAITLLLNATSEESSMRSPSIHRLRTCVDALESMGSRWLSAKRAITTLRELAERWKISRALPMRYSGPLHQADVARAIDSAAISRVGDPGHQTGFGGSTAPATLAIDYFDVADLNMAESGLFGSPYLAFSSTED
ncbi:hypothetical protein PFICI_11862 [Pestalotiopsis fici W106-1]|uniref:Zn(2)-C6 fungal-type domain-containing protein n=1 Tax=Pestalotiopsis fici (strain W106-1 / CGMCC3.15140) TaxID=1229662 RepID=W3WRI0_PESFW|nr:uncharacterized protein PFICI_11862 [Pestalotiopsis fici W106-1]ETS76475.1 hypothetical protein PFICI_11862 [Pestalotiopsis fici W106-1]